MLLIVFSILVSCSLLINLKFTAFETYYNLVVFFSQTVFLVGPLFYLYILSILNTNFKFDKHYWLHFIPFLAAIIFAVTVILTVETRQYWYYPGRFFLTSVTALQIFIYLIYSWRCLRENGLDFKILLSFINNSRLSLTRYFFVGFILLWSAQLQLFIGWDILKHPQWCPYAVSLYVASAFVFLTGILFIAMNKPESFDHVQKYQYSQLKQTDKECYREKIISIMEEDKLFLNPEILLSDIAEKLGIAPYYVSQVINELFKQNFRDFINKFRIEESKRLLTQPNQQLNMLGIALDVGFNSKSAFNNAFKKHTGVTPKVFKKKFSSLVSTN